MTLNAAKVLEFPWVFICGLEDGLLPHSRSIFAPEELEEERRLFYVGCTRAQDRLFLLHAKSRMFYGETHDVIPSQFLSDIPEELVENTATEFKNPFAGFFGNKGTRSRPAMPRGEGAIGNKPVPTEKPAQEFTDGEKVNHATFGDGIVISVVGGIITVAFKNPKIGIKKLAIAIAPLEKI
jgi:DNA helicase-2/ATP-dependent DNA helicase PcrA